MIVVGTGSEWIVDAAGCRPEALRDLALIRALLAEIVRDLALRPAAEPLYRAFDGEGGVTGMVLLTESHLTIHTFPEHGYAALNLYCCTPRAPWPWDARLRAVLGAREVRVRVFERAPGRAGDSEGPPP